MAFNDSLSGVEFSPHKYLRHAQRLQALSEGRDVFPVTVELDPVDYCNHGCGWCVDARHGRTALELDFARQLLAEFRVLGVQGVVYKGGGEPTLHAAFAELLELAAKSELEVGVVTNGSRLDVFAEPLARWARYLRVSIDGPTAESHRDVHGSQDFDRILRGVAQVVAQRGSRRHPVIGLSFAMDHVTAGLADEAVALGERLGVDYVLFRPPFFEEVGHASTMTTQQAREVRRAFEATRQNYHGPLRILVDHWISDREAAAELDEPSQPSPRRGPYLALGANGIEHVTGRCLASPLLAIVAADRTVYPCCNLRALDEWAVGRVDYDAGTTFRAVWEGEQRRRVMARIHQAACLRYCTHPLSKYNEAIEYLRGPQYHGGFV